VKRAIETAVGELRDNARLRAGVGAVVVILWLYALLAWGDAQSVREEQIKQLQQEINELRPFERTEDLWKQRLLEARSVSAGLQSYLWEARSRSLAEATFRDWLQGRAQSSGLRVRELNVRAQEAASTPGEKSTVSETAALGNDKLLPIRGRLVADFSPSSTSSLLLQVHEQPHHVLIQRLVIRNPPPPQEGALEVEVQALFALREGRP
jgi:hypothetical protein